MDTDKEAESRRKIGLERLGDYQGVIFGMGCRLFESNPYGPHPLEYLDCFHSGGSITGWERLYIGIKKGKRILYVISPPGAPELAIKCEYCLCHGPAKFGIGVGTAGSLTDEIKVGDIVVPMFSIRGEGTSVCYGYEWGEEVFSDEELAKKLRDRTLETIQDGYLKRTFLFPYCHDDKCLSTDAFCAEDEDFVKMAADKGATIVDMETSALFSVSLEHEKKAASILVISDRIKGDNPHFVDHVSEIVYKNVQKALKIATETLLDCI